MANDLQAKSGFEKFTPHCICRQWQGSAHLDLNRAPNVLYGDGYIDLVALTPHCICRQWQGTDSPLDLVRAPHVLYGDE